MHKGCRIEDVVNAEQRLVVGKGDADVAGRAAGKFLCERGKARGRNILCPRARVCHGDGGVLAKGTGEVAAKAADGEDEAARVKVRERLFFDGVERNGGEAAII